MVWPEYGPRDMDVAFQKPGARRRRSQSAFRIIFISAVFVILLVSASLIGRDFAVAPDAPKPTERYRGLVQLAPNERGLCDQLEFDNTTGSIRPKGTIGCDDRTATLPGRPGGSLGRLNGISQYFKSH